ncbi:LacI family DNA-binding transcriptional regulator [Agromyces seonyuensis]|uniref:Substrate-binding domain-containing protein n=1 Tax=Agromyces seonyuensis TaxID=2662446 RepID=A0A6I4NUH5_9MICO|nr:LacI family DNA-binding transcriptional regulator [Agromyces seonyuensis]MWB97930.1 substrate-binding domain-containing protein [Agromyces seonyuensis]
MSGPSTPARPTMSDVAAAAGVSLKTVSRVVNAEGYVSTDTVAAVKAAIEQLGFRRNDAARQLRQGTAATIGLIFEDQSDPFYSTLARAVEDVALAHGSLLLIASSNGDPAHSQTIVDAFTSRGVDGLIVAPAAGTEPGLLQREAAAGRAIVFVDRPVPGVDADTVLADNVGGAAAATAHLVANGHRRIAFFGDDPGVFTATERLAGYSRALREAGLEPDDRLVRLAAPTADGLDDVIGGVLDQTDPPTALITGNNRWSIRMLRHLKAHASRAPLAFVGFDDFELADVLDPAVTVVAQAPAEMGRIAAELLFRRVGGAEEPIECIRIPPRLIVRGSGELPGPALA